MEMIAEMIHNMDPAVAMATGSLIAAILAGGLFLSFLNYLAVAIGSAKMFGKAGIAGWKAFIPFYNEYNKYKMAWAPKFFFVNLVLYYGSSALALADNLALTLLGTAMAVASIVVMFKQEQKMAKAFGKGTGFAVLMLLFPFVTCPILGFGKSEYNAA